MRFLLLLCIPSALSMCGLCSTKEGDPGVDGLLHPSDFVDSKGKTCAQLMIELFPLDSNDPLCKGGISSSHERCCLPGALVPIVQDPPPQPPQFVVGGPYRRCDLCVGGGYPSVQSMVINMLYIGPGSCPQYYEWGQRGWIQTRLCQALQHFAREPCGCAVESRVLGVP